MDMRRKVDIEAEVAGTSRARRKAVPRKRAAVVPVKSLPVAPPAPDPSFLRDSYSSTAFAETMDRSLDAAIARYTTGLSPMAQMAAYWDWAAHLAFSPGKRLQL